MCGQLTFVLIFFIVLTRTAVQSCSEEASCSDILINTTSTCSLAFQRNGKTNPICLWHLRSGCSLYRDLACKFPSVLQTSCSSLCQARQNVCRENGYIS